MGRLYAKIRAKFPKETVDAGENERLSLVISHTAEDVIDIDDTQRELPIYEATTKEINYWHAFGSNVFLQMLLRRYELDFSAANVKAYNYFRIGYDEKKHRATFALDDIHFYVIDFNDYDSAPLDAKEARLVLEKISQIREEKSKQRKFCGFQIEYFD